MRRTHRLKALARRAIPLLSLLLVAPGHAQSELEKLPGYVDPHALGFFEEDDLMVEINLSGTLISFLSESLREEDSEFADLLANLRLIRANVYRLEEGRATAVARDTRALVRDLEKEGWEVVVRIRQREEIYILVKLDDAAIAGLAALFIDPPASAGLINIVGDFDPGKVARLGRRLKIDVFEALENGENGEASEEDRP